MRSIVIDGKEKQIFELGGKEYIAPTFISAGVRDTIGKNQLALMMNDDEFVSRLTRLKPANQRESVEQLEKIANEYATHNPVDFRISVLSVLLKPKDGSIFSLEKWKEMYFEDFKGDEVDEVIGFFTEMLNGKTNSDSSKTKSGSSTKVKARRSR